MATRAKRAFRLNGKTITACLVAWFVVCAVVYAVINIWEGSRRKALIRTGIAISKDISSQSGLPLLERNITVLSGLIEKIKERPEVVFASIIDHKNKIIAYTDQEQFFTLDMQKSGELEGVHYWRITNPNNQRVMNFSSEITFSNTRVGEVLISLAAENVGRLNRMFLFFSVFSLLTIVVLCGVFRYKECLSWWKALKENRKSSEAPFLADSGDPEFSCPLCGNHGKFSLNSFKAPDLEGFCVLKHYPETNRSIMLSDIANIEELGRFKRLIIAQCTRIIHKVAAE